MLGTTLGTRDIGIQVWEKKTENKQKKQTLNQKAYFQWERQAIKI